jgi:hypothetical protein
MSAYCVDCGSPIPDGQGRVCSMCYGDINYGRDGYYRRWAEDQMREDEERDHAAEVSQAATPRHEGGSEPVDFSKGVRGKYYERAKRGIVLPEPECVCEGEFIWACGPECDCFHHAAEVSQEGKGAVSVGEPTACAFVFDSKMPCHADLTHPVHHGAWKGPEPNHDFVYGGPPERKPTYREQVIATYLASPEAENDCTRSILAIPAGAALNMTAGELARAILAAWRAKL